MNLKNTTWSLIATLALLSTITGSAQEDELNTADVKNRVFGVGPALILHADPRGGRVGDSNDIEIDSNRILKVNNEDKFLGLSVGVQTFALFPVSDKVSLGPFVAAGFGEGVVRTAGGGLMLGIGQQDEESRQFLLGLGGGWDLRAKEIGGGFQEGQIVPSHITHIPLERKARFGYMATFGVTF